MTAATVDLIGLDLLSRCGLFANTSRETLIQVMGSGDRLHVNAKDVVSSSIDSANNFYCILSGGVKVSRATDDGKELIFDILGAGEFFGELSALDGGVRKSAVIALVPSDFLVLRSDAFVELLRGSAEIAIQLAKTLGARLRRMDSLLEDVLSLDAGVRVAKRLLALAKIFCEPSAQGYVKISLRMSQQEFAGLVGITRESVNKQFRTWEKAGVIELGAGSILLRDVQHLSSLVATT